MLERKPRIIFMGTSAFAVPIFKRLIASSFNIVAVFCQQDKPQGRGLKSLPCPVKNKAQEYNVSIFQPEDLKSEKVVRQIKDLKPKVIIVAAYGLFIPKQILNIPPKGCLNIHPSLLPKLRGPSPIQTAILNGEKITGVSLMLLDEKMDHGPIIAQRKIKIQKGDNQITLVRKLAKLGREILQDTLPLYLKGKIHPRAQDHSKATFTHLIKREDGKIDWQKSASQISRKIRAYLGWPGSFTNWQGKRIILWKAEAIERDRYREKNGEVFEIDSKPYVQCSQNILKIKKIQLAGKKVISGAEFLRGYSKIVGSSLN